MARSRKGNEFAGLRTEEDGNFKPRREHRKEIGQEHFGLELEEASGKKEDFCEGRRALEIAWGVGGTCGTKATRGSQGRGDGGEGNGGVTCFRGQCPRSEWKDRSRFLR